MQALRKRKETFHQWEYENQQQLERFILITRAQTQKQVAEAARFTSFLLYLAFGGGRMFVDLLRALLVSPMGIEHRYAEAARKRLELNAHPSLWVK